MLKSMYRVAFALGLVGLLACSTSGPDLSRASSPARAPLVLAAMQTRDYKITWLAGQKVRVEDVHGTVVADGVTIDDLDRIDPFLREACKSATAGTYVDARRDELGGPPMMDRSGLLWRGTE
jgi:hypothetical protein